MNRKKTSGYHGNRNAAKSTPRTSKIVVRVTPAEKGRAVKNAGGQKLSDYARSRLCS